MTEDRTDGTVPELDDASFDSPKPLRLVPALPSNAERNSFRRQLERGAGVSPESAAAVARAVVNPKLAGTLLGSPTSYRVPGAELQVIRVEVYTTRVIADATNPRTLNQIPFPAAILPGSDQRAKYAPIHPPSSSGPDDFSIAVDSIDQLLWQLNTTMQAAMRDNVPHPPIASQGIMEPPLAVPARIESAEGDPLLGAVLIREGSTRVSHAQAILGVTASDLLQVFVDDRAQRRLIDELNNLALSSASSLTEADRARLRVATMPLDLVVGVDVDAGASVSLGDAVAAKVAQDHLNHKKQWDPAAKDVHLGETCLIALRDEGLISDEKYAWLAGRIAANISSIDSFEVQEDDRWAELLWLFTTRKRPYATVIRRPIATVLERDQGRAVVRSRDRVPLAVALAMRSRRGLITETAAERESRILESAVPADVLASNWAPSSNEVEVLVAPAVEAAAQRSISAEGMELAVRAIWYLSKHGQLAMPRNDLGPGGDRRSPAELVDGMTKNARGVRQLARAILDGRDGAQASTVIDDRGSIDVSAVGTAVPLRDDTIRLEFVPRSGPAVPPPRNPDDEYLDAIATLTRRLKEAVQAEEDVRSIDDGRGRAMYQARGMMPAQVDELREMLQLLGSHTDEYERNWRVADAIRQQTSTPSDG